VSDEPSQNLYVARTLPLGDSMSSQRANSLPFVLGSLQVGDEQFPQAFAVVRLLWSASLDMHHLSGVLK